MLSEDQIDMNYEAKMEARAAAALEKSLRGFDPMRPHVRRALSKRQQEAEANG